jgi:hypothetical protein
MIVVDPATLPAQAQGYFQDLATAAADLNQATDQLSDAIGAIEVALKTLNLGIEGWVTVYTWDEDRLGTEIGYARIGNKWCIGIREYEVHVLEEISKTVTGLWPFNEAPRKLRTSVIEGIPALLKELKDEAERNSVFIRSNLALAKTLASALRGAPITKGSKQ